MPPCDVLSCTVLPRDMLSRALLSRWMLSRDTSPYVAHAGWPALCSAYDVVCRAGRGRAFWPCCSVLPLSQCVSSPWLWRLVPSHVPFQPLLVAARRLSIPCVCCVLTAPAAFLVAVVVIVCVVLLAMVMVMMVVAVALTCGVTGSHGVDSE